MSTGLLISLLVLVAAAGFAIGYIVRRLQAESRIGSAEAEAKRIIDQARHTGESLRREALVEVKEESHRMRSQVEQANRESRRELQRLENRLLKREESIERRVSQLDRREELLRRREQDLSGAEAHLEDLTRRQEMELERVAGLTAQEAKAEIFHAVELETRAEMAQLVRDLEREARSDAEKRAKEIISTAIQRCAAEHVAESTVSTVTLPSDDMKGRVIGREGRNIRTFEALTGVDLIIDDTPEAVVVSCFDPVRREKARVALERLVADGRIHPARIEEMYEKSVREVDGRIKELGEQAMYDAGVPGLHPELIKLLGQLAFRTSYGQNVLKHSVEVAHLAALMAMELEVNADVARRAGLLHDIGKALDHEHEGTHVTIGMDVLKRFGETEPVIHAMACHHGDFEPQSVEAVLVAAADALSAARPGARRESLEAYIKRLRQLEDIANSFDGVAKSYAIQAGREVRILVRPDKVDDAEAHLLARNVVKEVKQQVQFPGQIKIVVIRETRVTDYAR